MFTIEFINLSGGQPATCSGVIRLGEFSEAFEASLGYWKKEQYASQWEDGIRRVVEQQKNSCLITSITDPSNSNFLIWWPIYVHRSVAIFHNHLLFIDDAKVAFDVNEPYLSLPPYESTNEDGQQISEWRVPVSDLDKWLRSFTKRGNEGQSVNSQE